MNILVIGSGGREHALCKKFHESQNIKKIFCAPGNGGTSLDAENVHIPVDDLEGLAQFATGNGIDFTFVGPEVPLAAGIVDFFENKGLKIFGPNQKAAMLEGSKAFAKDFMARQEIPTAGYRSFDNLDAAAAHLKNWPENKPVVVKADGLAAGKGVFVCQGRQDAESALSQIMGDKVFGNAGDQIVVEEFLNGEEVSVLLFTDGESYAVMPPAQDHKRAFDNDQGPNTGGMGAYAPAPLADKALMEKVEGKIIKKVMGGFAKDAIDYRGVLYIGLMVVDGEPFVLEFNVRFGDPETQVILPLLKTSLADISMAVIDKKLKDIKIEWQDKAAVSVVLASGGYPGKITTGYEITGLENVSKDCIVFHSGTKVSNGKILTAGGRVLCVTAVEDNIKRAAEKAYENVQKIKFENVHYRKDIAQKALVK